MKNLFIKKINVSGNTSIEEAAHILETQTVSASIDVLNWKNEFPYKPNLKFRIGHMSDQIWLKFYVKEKFILAQETKINGDVYKDSTVEFFISIDGKNYYNFEFNCIGTPHVAHGPGRGDRTFVSPKLVEKIKIKSTLGNKPFDEKSGDFEWEMMICIPIECFAFDQLDTFDGLRATANFYKCGDNTSEPHFVSWSPITTNNPDYHRREFFGNIQFE